MSSSYITLFGSLCNSVPSVVPPPSPVPTIAPTSTPAPAQPTATGTLPDLIITQLSGPASLILKQDNTQVATYKVTVLNVGLAAAGQFNVGMILPDGTLRDMGLVASLAPGQQAIFQTDVTFTTPGTVRITAFADSNNTVVESSENDNLFPMDIVLIKPTPLPTSAGATATSGGATATSGGTTTTVTVTTTTTATVTATFTSTPTLTPTP
jgi:subtilase family serine protease